MSLVISNHRANCYCKLCQLAREKEEQLSPKPKRKVPRAVMEAWKEKQAKQQELELWNGVMSIECPHCHHFVKVKVGPTIKCTACAKEIK